MIRVGFISYLNTLPIYWAIENKVVDLGSDVELVSAVPSVLNNMLSEGRLDISVVSSFEYALNYKKYLILPELSIASKGEVKSVLFLSKFPIEELDGRVVYLTKASLTSKYLMLYIFKRKSISPKLVEFSLANSIPKKGYSGILLIGDDALRFRSSNTFPFVYDLSALWKDYFDLPFVFALWCVRRQTYLERKDKVERLWKSLLKSKNIGKRMFHKIASTKALELGLSYDECLSYLNVLHFDLEKEYIQGLRKFFSEMYKWGFLNEMPELNFIQY